VQRLPFSGLGAPSAANLLWLKRGPVRRLVFSELVFPPSFLIDRPPAVPVGDVALRVVRISLAKLTLRRRSVYAVNLLWSRWSVGRPSGSHQVLL